jgi:hypothetical protein
LFVDTFLANLHNSQVLADRVCELVLDPPVGAVDALPVWIAPSRSKRDQPVRPLDTPPDTVADLLPLKVLPGDNLTTEGSDQRKDQVGNPVIPLVVAETDEDSQPAPSMPWNAPLV